MDDLNNPFDSTQVAEALNDGWKARREVADACRRLILALSTCTTDADTLREIAGRLERDAALMERGQQLCGRRAYLEADSGRYGNFASLGYELNPLSGRSNPVAPPLHVWMDGDRAYGSCVMPWQYEGPPDAVHGGFVAALFDHFLGVAQKLTKQPGFTGTLSTRFVKPTPIGVELKLVGEVVKVEGRKNFLRGEMWAGDVLTATCDGLFIRVAGQTLPGQDGGPGPREN